MNNSMTLFLLAFCLLISCKSKNSNAFKPASIDDAIIDLQNYQKNDPNFITSRLVEALNANADWSKIINFKPIYLILYESFSDFKDFKQGDALLRLNIFFVGNYDDSDLSDEDWVLSIGDKSYQAKKVMDMTTHDPEQEKYRFTLLELQFDVSNFRELNISADTKVEIKNMRMDSKWIILGEKEDPDSIMGSYVKKRTVWPKDVRKICEAHFGGRGPLLLRLE